MVAERHGCRRRDPRVLESVTTRLPGLVLLPRRGPDDQELLRIPRHSLASRDERACLSNRPCTLA